ncbi:MAG: hypothetical protein HY356_02680 [Gammaproteobacteria bacterium]|nr:hypothetical protein [Gammaproteobacteria bacterium]
MTNVLVTLQEAYAGKLTKLGYLHTIAGLNDTAAADFCFVSPHTYRRWRTDRKPNPCAVRLLAILAGYVPWSGWEKWFYNHYDQKLYCHDLKYGFSPSDFYSYHYLKLAYESLQEEVLYLRQQLKDLSNAERPEASILDDPSIVPFPTLSPMLRRVKTEAQTPEKLPSRSKNGGFRDRFAGLLRRMVR